jgi:Zn-dependent protease with chaperone function
MSLRAFETPLQEDETRADLHSARILIEKLSVNRPSIVAAALFKKLDEDSTNRTSMLHRILHFLFGGVHPSDKERIRAIRELEQSNHEGVDE